MVNEIEFRNMKKLFNLLMIACLFSFFGCKDDNFVDEDCQKCLIEELGQSQGMAYLNEKYAEIEAISTSVVCTDPSNWEYVAIGSKACGGPTGYIAYSKSIEKVSFLNKVEKYTAAQAAYNKKWNIASDCSVVGPPKSIICMDGKPKFNN
jgi:hypothetical protein